MWFASCNTRRRTLCATAALVCFMLSIGNVEVGALEGAVDNEVGIADHVTAASSFGVVHDGQYAGALCVAFEGKIFVRSEGDGGSRTWAEHGPDMQRLAHFTQSYLSEDSTLIQLSDQGRGLRLFFDARDADAVLAYWCLEKPSCVWNVLVTDGELRQGRDVDCTSLRAADPARVEAGKSIRVVEPEMRLASLSSIGGIAMVTAGTSNLIKVSSLSAELNMRYARMHDYAFYQYHDVMVPKYMVTWNKVRVLMDMLNRTKHEWVMWVDTDAVVTNRSVRVEDIITAAESLEHHRSPNDHSTLTNPRSTTLDLLLCDDIGGWELNTGVMLWRNTQWSKDMLKKLWAMEHLPHMRGAEQGQLIELLRREDPTRRRHHIFHQSVFNAHPKVHHDGLFMIHMMGFSEQDRVTTFKGIRARLDGDGGNGKIL